MPADDPVILLLNSKVTFYHFKASLWPRNFFEQKSNMVSSGPFASRISNFVQTFSYQRYIWSCKFASFTSARNGLFHELFHLNYVP